MIKIIPKEEIERQNALRYDLLQKKHAFARTVFDYQKTHPDFIGTDEQIAALEDEELKAKLQAEAEACRQAVLLIDPGADWFSDIAEIIQQYREEEENMKEEE